MLSLICNMPLFFGNIRGMQFVIIVIVILLLFGGKKIPEMMRTMGKGVHAFKQGLAEAKEEINKPVETPSSDKADEKKKETETEPETESKKQ